MSAVLVLAALVCTGMRNCLLQQNFHCSFDLIILLPLHSVPQSKARGFGSVHRTSKVETLSGLCEH